MQFMKRGYDLPGGCKDLSEEIRVISPEGVNLGRMTVAEAQRRAVAVNAELVLLTPDLRTKIFRLVDDSLRQRLRKEKG
jgi:translation initiation factor IF-3